MKHFDAEKIEAYALAVVHGSLDEGEALTIEIEEHLLFCQECLSRVQHEELFAQAIRSGCAKLPSFAPPPTRKLTKTLLAASSRV